MTEAMIVRGGTGRAASTLELFFDLVYVFAITQVVGLIHGDPTAKGLLKGALLLMILWWTWSIYTWTTNWTGTSTAAIKLFLLATMGTTLVMATAVPGAFEETSILFAGSLFVVRILGAGLYWVASKEYEEQRKAFFTFFPVSFLAAVTFLVGGFVEGGLVIGFFLAGSAIDLLAAMSAGRGTWAVDASHFSERNGLFVIIALGESVVGLGLTAVGVGIDAIHGVALIVGFVGVAGMWWAYFDRAAPYSAAFFEHLEGKAAGRYARDVYSMIHYPLVVGIIYFAVALEDVLAHPSDTLPTIGRIALSGGIALVLLSVVAGTYRAIRRITWERLAGAAVVVGLIWLGAGIGSLIYAAVAVGILTVTLMIERTHPWPEPRTPVPAS